MRALCGVLALLWLSSTYAYGQSLVDRRVLSGNGSDQPTVVATDSDGFVYMAGVTTSANFPTTNGLQALPPQGALEVSINGAAFGNSGLTVTNVSAVAASSDGTLVLASTPGGIFRSTDAGAAWTAAASLLSSAAALAVDPANPANAYALLRNGAYYKSTDGGMHWQATGASFVALQNSGPWGLSQIAINPQTPSTMYLWDNFIVYESTDSGVHWQPLAIPNASSPQVVWSYAMSPSQPNILYASGFAPASPGSSVLTGTIFKSSDGGATWTAGATKTGAYGPTAMAVDPRNPSILWAADGIQNVYKSADGGATFAVVESVEFAEGTFPASVAIDPANPSRVYVSTGFSVIETSNGGQSWSNVGPSVYSLYAAPSHIFALSYYIPSSVFLAKFDGALSQVIYSTYLWAGTVAAITVDAGGNVYLAGADATGSTGVVMKMSAADHSMLYSAVFSGAVPYAIAIDSSGNAVIAGSATALATTKGAYQPNLPGACLRTIDPTLGFPQSEPSHAFLAKLNASGQLTAATYLTGACGDTAYAVALDSADNVYVAGETYAADFPITGNAMVGAFPSTYSAGFVAEVSPDESQLTYSSFLGSGYFTAVHALKLDGAGNVYLAGSTYAEPTAGDAHLYDSAGCGSPSPYGGPHPTPPPNGDNPFVMKMTLSSAPPAFLAAVGGSCGGEADALAFDGAGNIWLTGRNTSWDFPSIAPVSGLAQVPEQDLFYYGSQMGFLAELNPSGSNLLSSTITDSTGYVTADSTAVYYVGGLGDVNASGVPTGNYAALAAEINPSQASSIFVDEITMLSPLQPPASLLSSAVAPGEIIRIVGRGIGPQDQAGAKLAAGVALPNSISGVTVTFNNVPAPLVTVQADLIVAIVPFEVNGLTAAAVQVQYNGITSNTYTVPVVAQNPDILAVVNSNWTGNSPTNPAQPGSVVTIFVTGLGQTNPPSLDGAANGLPLAQPVVEPSLTFDGSPATAAFLGAAVYEAAGVSQINFVIPAGTPAGSSSVGIDLAFAPIYVAQ